MRTFVFAIGGSGARVLKSLSMLLASGCKGTATNNTIVPIIIDYDTTNGDTLRTQDILCNYQSLNQTIFGTLKDNDNTATTDTFFCNPIQRLKDAAPDGDFDAHARFEVFLKETDTNLTFGRHIGVNTLNSENGTLPSRHLMDALYDNSPENSKTTELNLNLSVGFKGCPNIGCVVTKSLESSVELQEFFNIINPEDRIIIIGSIFGGTGASGIPMLLDLIKEKPTLSNCIVGVVAICPYFKVTPNPNSAISSDTFTAKTKAALDAYALGKSVNKQASAIYYVGDNYLPGAFSNSEGGKDQKNKAHLVELVAAMDVLSFISDNTLVVSTQVDAKAYEFGFKPVEKNNIKEGVDANILGFDRFFEEQTLEPYLYPLCKLLVFCKFCEEYFLKCGDGEKRDTWLRNTGLAKETGFKELLEKFIKYFYEWIEELQDATLKRGIALFNPKKSYDDLFKGLVTKSGSIFLSHMITNEEIRKQLAGLWDKETLGGKEKLKVDRPEEFFVDSMEKVTTTLMKKVVEYNKKR